MCRLASAVLSADAGMKSIRIVKYSWESFRSKLEPKVKGYATPSSGCPDVSAIIYGFISIKIDVSESLKGDFEVLQYF